MQMSNEQLRFTHQIENSYTERVLRLLSPLYGADNLRVQVTASIDHTAEERTVEQFGQEGSALRSEQISEDTSNQPEAGGVVGALAAAPPEPQAGAEGDQAGSSSRRSTRNYEVDRTISHIKDSGGQIDRLSVAVVLNYREEEVAVAAAEGAEAPEEGATTTENRPVPPAEIAQIEQVVREAIGFDANRGDSVSITSAQFFTIKTEAPEPLGFMDTLSDYTGAFQMALGFLALLALIFGVLRPMLKSLVSASAEAVVASAQPRYVTPEGVAYDAQGQPMALAGGQYPAQMGGAPGGMPQQSYDQQLGRARAVVQEDPARVAGVLKDWVASDG
jgi:flagellar M-ring protein FliF